MILNQTDISICFKNVKGKCVHFSSICCLEGWSWESREIKVDPENTEYLWQIGLQLRSLDNGTAIYLSRLMGTHVKATCYSKEIVQKQRNRPERVRRLEACLPVQNSQTGSYSQSSFYSSEAQPWKENCAKSSKFHKRILTQQSLSNLRIMQMSAQVWALQRWCWSPMPSQGGKKY